YPKKKPFNRSVTNRESVTVLEAISADGFVCPPLIILSAKQALLRWFDTIEEDKYLAITNTGYINDTLAYHRKRLVLYNRFGSYLTRQFVQFCEKNNIILFFLLSYTSHILQPLDIGPINPKLITDKLELYNPYLSRSNTPSTTSQNTEFSTLKTAEKNLTGRKRLGVPATPGITLLVVIYKSPVKEMKRKEYKLSEKADQEKTRRKWKKVLVEIRKHGRAKKRRGDL
ncbi:hypothetical protein N7527_007603, partial [Penicillium freii]